MEKDDCFYIYTSDLFFLIIQSKACSHTILFTSCLFPS